jgi:tRNA nucleotidyltransferase/poly(A) polymerase
MCERAAEGIERMRELSLLKYIIPELEEGYKVTQNKHHIYDCYEHYLRSLDYATKKGFNMYVRLAALFHDIGKPRTKRVKDRMLLFMVTKWLGQK